MTLINEPPEMVLLRGPLSKRATSAEFNEWQAREIVAYIDRLIKMLERAAELTFEEKTAVNIRFQELRAQELQRGTHGDTESIFVAMHGAYAAFLTGRLTPRA